MAARPNVILRGQYWQHRGSLAHSGDAQATQHHVSRVHRCGHPDEIVKAIRQNMLFGARTIKLCIDCKPWGYSVDDIRLAIREAAKGGCKVEGHVQTADGAQRRSMRASTSSLTAMR
jgi:hypothetical protein